MYFKISVTYNSKKLMQMVNEAKRKSFKNTPIYMSGVKVPKNQEQAVQFDEENGNILWQDAEKEEIDQMFEHNVLLDNCGHCSTTREPPGHKKIKLHIVYACKQHDWRRKARIITGGHLTDALLESVYSGVVSLCGMIRLIVFLSELVNNLEVYQTDIGDAFLEARTTEKVFIVAGGEFVGELKDHIFVIG